MSVKIILDHYSNACSPGQTIAGRVICDFNQEEKMRAIRIHFKGSAKTKWNESRGGGKSRRTVRFYAEEDYFNSEYNLLEGGEDFTLPEGNHVFPFAYILPTQLPSTCDMDYGRVHYKIKATVDRPWKFDYECEFYFNVVSPLDLNYLPEYREPHATSNDKEVSCCCVTSGPVKLDVSLPIRGFVPGQDVNVGCYVQNLSNSSISEVRFKIKAVFEFIAHHPHTKSRNSEVDIVRYADRGIGAHGEKSWTATFPIPHNNYVNLMTCSIINFSYLLEIEAVLPFPHTNLTINIPIMIGSVPIAGITSAVPGPPLAQYPIGFELPPVLNPSAPEIPNVTAPYPYEGAQGYPNPNLPTYTEVTKDKM